MGNRLRHPSGPVRSNIPPVTCKLLREREEGKRKRERQREKKNEGSVVTDTQTEKGASERRSVILIVRDFECVRRSESYIFTFEVLGLFLPWFHARGF